MSIEKRVYPPSKRHPRKRTTWRVRWKEQGQHRSCEVATHAEARALHAEVTSQPTPEATAAGVALSPAPGQIVQPQLMLLPDGRIVQLVEVPTLASIQQPVAPAAPVAPASPTLAEFWREWIEHRALRSAPSTIATYECAWQRHVEPALGSLRLDEIEQRPRVLSDLFAQLGAIDPKTNAARVGAPTRRKVFMLLRCVLRTAVAWNHLNVNPMDRLDERAPSQKRQRSIVVFSALHVERMRRRMLARTTYGGGMIRDLPFPARNLRDAALLTTLAYCGLRPAEALALRW